MTSPRTASNPRPGTVLRRKWRQYRWVATGAMAVAVLVLGIIGFGQYRSPPTYTGTLPFMDRLYDTVGLFSFSTPVTPPLPTTLEVARWLAPIAVAYAGFATLAAIFTDQWARLRVWLMFRSHVIVVGLGHCGLRLATRFQERGDHVVAVDKAPSAAAAMECADRGIPLVRGDGTEAAILTRAGLRRARVVIIVCGDEGTNAEAALQVTRLSQQSRSILRVLVNIGDPRLCQLLEQAALTTLGDERLRLEFFNVSRLGPRALLGTWPPRAAADGTPPWIVVAGSGPVALSLLVEIAHRWRLEKPAGAGPCQVTLVAPDAADRIDALQARFPSLAGSVDLAAVKADPADPAAAPLPALTPPHGALLVPTPPLHPALALTPPPHPALVPTPPPHPIDPAAVAFACLDTDPASVQAAIRLRRALPAEVPVVACSAGRAGASLITLLDRSRSGYLVNVHAFGLLDQICRPEVVLNLDSEAIARAMHQDYVRRRLAEGADAASDLALRAWEDLPEGLRESNRQQVADIREKLRQVGYEFVATDDWNIDPVAFTDEQVETLAIREHDRWCKERLADDWHYGPVRDTAAKLSPYLVPWADLTDDVRDRDREPVRLIPTVLATAGYKVVPLSDGHDAAPAPPATAALSPDAVGQPTDDATRTPPGPA